MNFTQNIILAIRSIKANLLRAGITLSIIALGIMALVGILTAISAIKATINSSFSVMGSNTFTIRANTMQIGGNAPRVRNEKITYQQALDFKNRYDYPSIVSISCNIGWNYELRNGSLKTNPNISVFGVDDNYLKVSSFNISNGRPFSETEQNSGRNVVVLGDGIVKKCFSGAANAIGKMVLINNEPFEVIGVLANMGSTGFMNMSNMAIIPIQKARNMQNENATNYTITVMLNEAKNIPLAKDQAQGIFRMIRLLSPNMPDNFTLQSANQITESVMEQLSLVTIAATFIGLITLIGAGIGLMNIMLVSVTDRTREIGISKAIGATKSHIRIQFLTEAILICLLGGLIGVMLGIGIGNIVSILLKGPFVVPWFWMISGLIFCFVMGVIAGYYPANKAAQLDPIEALRYE